jgi:hypothetical protein
MILTVYVKSWSRYFDESSWQWAEGSWQLAVGSLQRVFD